jgi:hypothetical protein
MHACKLPLSPSTHQTSIFIAVKYDGTTKRFYEKVGVQEMETGFAVTLGGRRIGTLVTCSLASLLPLSCLSLASLASLGSCLSLPSFLLLPCPGLFAHRRVLMICCHHDRTTGKIVALPSASLAHAVAHEWDCQVHFIKPHKMPLVPSMRCCFLLIPTLVHFHNESMLSLRCVGTVLKLFSTVASSNTACTLLDAPVDAGDRSSAHPA